MPTPVFCCGFECGQLGNSNGQHFFGSLGTPTISTTTVRTGNRSLRINPTASAMTARSAALTTSSFWVVRFYVRFTTLPGTNFRIMLMQTANNGVVFNPSDSTLRMYHSSASTQSSDGVVITTGVWYRVDYSYDGSGGTSVQNMKVDGVSLTQFSGGASGSTTQINFGDSAVSHTTDMFIDDVIISHTLADFPLGAGYVDHFIPTADGAHNIAGTADFRRTLTATDILNSTTDAFELVNDVPLESGASVDWINMLAPPNATDYVECIFGPAPGVSTPTVGPRAVEVIAGIHQAATGTGNMEIRLNDNGTMGTVYSATTVAGVTSVAYKRAHFADPPSAASVWHANNDGSDGDFRDLRVRFGSPAALDVNPDQFFDCIMIEAEFAEVVSVFPAAYDRTTEQPYLQKRLITGAGQKNNAVKP